MTAAGQDPMAAVNGSTQARGRRRRRTPFGLRRPPGWASRAQGAGQAHFQGDSPAPAAGRLDPAQRTRSTQGDARGLPTQRRSSRRLVEQESHPRGPGAGVREPHALRSSLPLQPRLVGERILLPDAGGLTCGFTQRRRSRSIDNRCARRTVGAVPAKRVSWALTEETR